MDSTHWLKVLSLYLTRPNLGGYSFPNEETVPEEVKGLLAKRLAVKRNTGRSGIEVFLTQRGIDLSRERGITVWVTSFMMPDGKPQEVFSLEPQVSAIVATLRKGVYNEDLGPHAIWCTVTLGDDWTFEEERFTESFWYTQCISHEVIKGQPRLAPFRMRGK